MSEPNTTQSTLEAGVLIGQTFDLAGQHASMLVHQILEGAGADEHQSSVIVGCSDERGDQLKRRNSTRGNPCVDLVPAGTDMGRMPELQAVSFLASAVQESLVLPPTAHEVTE